MIRKIVRGTGELLITLGLVILLFAAYEVYGKTFQVHAEQRRLDRALEREWQQDQPNPDEPVEPIPGNALARLHIPRLDKQWVVVEGVDLDDIELAPGHYPKSQLPGDAGNFAVAGHRTPAIFWDLDRVREDDPIVLEDATNWYIYRTYQTRIVRPTDIDVVAPDPDDPDSTSPPTRKLLTLTTCNPKFDNYQRLIVHAELDRTVAKTKGKPSELGG